VIEAISGRGHHGIQWHSESDGTAGRIYGAFVRLCGRQEQVESLGELSPAPQAA
jgi:hypothetical protein